MIDYDTTAPVGEPRHTYDLPPNGTIPDWQCPCCGANLEHFRRTNAMPTTTKTTDVGFFGADDLYGDEEVAAIPQLLTEHTATVQATDSVLFDHPRLGGRLTLFVMLHGNDRNRHKRLIDSIATTRGLDRLEIRLLGCVPAYYDQSRFDRLEPAVVYLGPKLRKVEMMRKAMHDPQHPLKTSWLIWVDDAAWFCHPEWLNQLAREIVAQPIESKVGLLGKKLCHVLSSSQGDPRLWFRQAAWFHGRDFRNRQGAEAPNGDCIHYVSSNMFAISREAAICCDVPDCRLTQAGSGIVIGEQLHQNGYAIKAFDSDNRLVRAPLSRNYAQTIYPWQ